MHVSEREQGAPGPRDSGGAQEQPPREPAWKRRQRLAEIFGDVLPEQTSDDRPGEPADGPGGSATDRWLESQVPPHHG